LLTWALFRRACIAAYRDGCFGTAKAVAYSALLSFIPVLTAITTILVQAKAQAVAETISRFLFQIVPPGTQEIVAYSFAVKGERPVWLLVLATLLSVWAASGAMVSLMEGFRKCYRIREGRPFLKDRGTAILLVFCTALPIIGASALILFAGRIEAALARAIGLIPEYARLTGWLALLGRIVSYGIAVAATSLVTALLYHFGPNRPRSWRRVWPGAVVATALWMLATAAFAWYVTNLANYNVMYGSVGAVIALLVWMYVLAVVALIGCEVNAERERSRG
jgi:membrane protein